MIEIILIYITDMIQKIIWVASLLLLLTSCGQSKPVELTQQLVSKHYNSQTQTLDLSNQNLSGFITLKWYLKWAVVNTIDLSNNNIQDIDLRNLDTGVWIDLSDNQFRFGSDILLPDTVRHLDLSNNQLETLDTLDRYQKIQTINVSNNPLGDDALWFVWELRKLRYANIDNTLAGSWFIDKFKGFNAWYLLNNEPVY